MAEAVTHPKLKSNVFFQYSVFLYLHRKIQILSSFALTLGNFRANLANSIKINLLQELYFTTDPVKLILVIQGQPSLSAASKSLNLVQTRSCEQRAGTGFLPNPDFLELKQL